MMGQTPQIDSMAKQAHLHRPLRAAELHRRTRRVHYRPDSPPHRQDDHRHSRLATWLQKRIQPWPRSSNPQATDRAVRQEPPGRSQRNLPTVHGFDEWFGNLYHFNAQEEPGNRLPRPKTPRLPGKVRSTRVLHTYATDVDDPTMIQSLAA